jgi:hypothetical protein
MDSLGAGCDARDWYLDAHDTYETARCCRICESNGGDLTRLTQSSGG